MKHKHAAANWTEYAKEWGNWLLPPVPEHAWGRSAQEDAQLRDIVRQQDSANLRKGLLGGLAGGLGIGALYYLSQAAKNKMQQATHVPDAEELAAAPITDMAEPEPEEAPILPESLSLGKKSPQPALKAAFDKNLLLFPAVGAGAGALIGHARGEKGKKNRNALLGATLGAAGGLGIGAATSKPVFDAIANRIPRTYEDILKGLGITSSGDVPAETGLHGGVRNVLGLTLPAAGAYGGLVLADSAMQQDTGKRNRDAVQSARKEYFNALTGRGDEPAEEEENEKKSAALDAFLDGAFQAYREKHGEEQAGAKDTLLGRLNPAHLWREYVRDPYKDLSAGAHALLIGGGLGAGAIGAKYMYDKTKAQSAARNRERARAARERMKGLTAPWIDPRELADVKALAAAGEPAARGV